MCYLTWKMDPPIWIIIMLHRLFTSGSFYNIQDWHAVYVAWWEWVLLSLASIIKESITKLCLSFCKTASVSETHHLFFDSYTGIISLLGSLINKGWAIFQVDISPFIPLKGLSTVIYRDYNKVQFLVVVVWKQYYK